MKKDVKEKVKKEVIEAKPKKTIRIPKFWKSTLFWVFLLFLQMGVLYGISYWGYHNSRTPVWFDSWVQENGIWKIYGKRVVNFEYDDFSLTNEKVALKERGIEILYSGFTTGVSDNSVEVSFSTSESKLITFKGPVRLFSCGYPIVSYAQSSEIGKVFRGDGCNEVKGYDPELLEGKYLIVSVNNYFDTDNWWINIYYSEDV